MLQCVNIGYDGLRDLFNGQFDYLSSRRCYTVAPFALTLASGLAIYTAFRSIQCIWKKMREPVLREVIVDQKPVAEQQFAYKVIPFENLMRDLEVLKTLAQKSPQRLNEKDTLGRTALHLALLNRNKEIYSFLLQCEHVDVNAQDHEFLTPKDYALIYAAYVDPDLFSLFKKRDLSFDSEDFPIFLAGLRMEASH